MSTKTTTSSLLLKLLLFLLLETAISGPFCREPDDDDNFKDALGNHELVEWIRAGGGIINPKQEIRHNVSSVVRGVYATKPIIKGEILCSIPWDLIIIAEGEDIFNYEKEEYDFDEDENEEEEIQENMIAACGTTRAVIREMRLGNMSRFAPFVRDLLSKSHRQIPDAWSESGRALLARLLGIEAYDRFWLDDWWHGICNGQYGETFEENTAMLVVPRLEDDLMIPFSELYNHRNGYKWLNADVELVTGERFDVIATRDIEVGEQIYISYNMCSKCEKRADNYDTADLFEDYGFVEDMPQRWIFEEIDVRFDLDENSSGDLFLTWFFPKDEHGEGENFEGGYGNGKKKSNDKKLGELTQSHVLEASHYFNDKILHLVDFEMLRYIPNDVVPKHEWDTIWQYHDALITAIATAIKSLELEMQHKKELMIKNEK